MGKEKCENSFPVQRKQVENAVKTLLEVLKEKGSSKHKIMDGHPRISLMVTTHKISSKRDQVELVALPHPIFTYSSDICVFTKDTNRRDTEESQEHYQELFRKDVGFVPKIIPITSFKKDYKSYEAKRHLSDAYDLFIADKALFNILSDHLGKHFYKKKKQPVYIDLGDEKLKERFARIVASTRWFVTGNGNCSMVHVAFANYTQNDIVDNVETCIKAISSTVMRGWANVRSLHLKSEDSLAIPVYINDEVSDELKEKDGKEVDFLQKIAKKRNADDIYSIPNKKIYESFSRDNAKARALGKTKKTRESS